MLAKAYSIFTCEIALHEFTTRYKMLTRILFPSTTIMILGLTPSQGLYCNRAQECARPFLCFQENCKMHWGLLLWQTARILFKKSSQVGLCHLLGGKIMNFLLLYFVRGVQFHQFWQLLLFMSRAKLVLLNFNFPYLHAEALSKNQIGKG